MNTYTVFCSEPDGSGTMWIDTVQANTPADAADLGLVACYGDWFDVDDEDSDPLLEKASEYVVVRGVAEGAVNILMWEDCDD